MPPCGNFGLISLSNPTNNGELDTDIDTSINSKTEVEVIKSNVNEIKPRLLSVFDILQAQTACTEIRGGQAGGISCFEYDNILTTFEGHHHKKIMPLNSRNTLGHTTISIKQPKANRVRVVARKRYPLAVDLLNLYKRKAGSRENTAAVKSFIGHTRFATSSINVVSELHPHEFVPFHFENVWQLNQLTGRFDKLWLYTGIHITHNGDFDALHAYDSTMENGEVGLWLERILHTPNDTKGDSPKVL